MKDCKSCKKAIFCPTWGHYKCTEHKIVVEPTDKAQYCELYSKRSEKDEMPECHCEECEERGKEEEE